jgi:hypothetical protein
LFGLVSAYALGTDPEASQPTPITGTTEIAYSLPRKLCELANRDIKESSGLAASRRQPNVFWTHNDSGDKPRIFAFDVQGKDLGTIAIRNAQARDWEDMASFELDGQSYLLLADVGDNNADRPAGTLYLVPEPRLNDSNVARPTRTVQFHFEEGPLNCEAIGFDPVRREVLLASKEIGFSTRIFLLPWPEPGQSAALAARQIATVPVPIATAMDVSPDGRRAVVATYGHAYQYERGPDDTWQQGFAKPGRLIRLPARRQGESICFGTDGRTLYLTSEKRPTPLFEVQAQ